MANSEQLEILMQGVEVWNTWKKENGNVMIDLARANLHGAQLKGVQLYEADISEADFSEANLINSDLGSTNARNANFSGADIRWADLTEANFSGAILRGAKLVGSNLSETCFEDADLTDCNVYAISAWNLRTNKNTKQTNLTITRSDESTITVDNIKVAQFIYLILKNEEIRDAINTLTSKSVLILGRFADDKRKTILNTLRNKLREYNLLPIVFDFERPIDRNITETVKTLAGISYFVIADVTSPKSSPLELQAIVPDYQIPVVPIIQDDDLPFSMINDLRTQHSGLLDPLTYDSEETLIRVLKSAIIDPAIEKHNELRLIKAQKPKIRSAKDFLDKEME
jgi:hypothetical protein